MLVAVISDTHNNGSAIKAVKKYISNADILLFLGDGEEDIKKISEGFEGEIYAVSGNCDFSGRNPQEMIVEVLDKKIFICHGHKYNVKYGYNSIFYKGKELGVDMVLFGHSHTPMIDEKEDLILMNPGSVSHGHGPMKRSLGYIEIEDDKKPMAYIREIIT